MKGEENIFIICGEKCKTKTLLCNIDWTIENFILVNISQSNSSDLNAYDNIKANYSIVLEHKQR